jgi:hypothetical protein
MTPEDLATVEHAKRQTMFVQFDYKLSGAITERHTVAPSKLDGTEFNIEYVSEVRAVPADELRHPSYIGDDAIAQLPAKFPDD